MTVKQLRATLESLPDSYQVILQGDPEGNYYKPLYGVDGNDLSYMDGQIYEEPKRGSKKCVVLWPSD